MNAKRRLPENTRLVLGVALALWAASVTLAGALGALASVGPRLGMAMASFATVFAVATYYLDRGVRATVDGIDTRAIAALLAAGLAAVAWIALEGTPRDSLVRAPRIVVAFFVGPVTIALLVALFDRLLRALAHRAVSPVAQRKAGGTRAAAA